MKPKNILICPLDWGIGHATRCISVIRALTEAGMNVIICADKRPHALLEKEFPELEFIRLTGYDIDYPSDDSMAIEMARQTPKIIRETVKEHMALRRIVKRHNIDLVISDNRFGLWSRRIPCVYMTHQLMVKFPPRLRNLEPIFYNMHKSLIQRYTECWIPDRHGTPNLSGDLSHKYPLPDNAHFIGLLSRFKKHKVRGKIYDISDEEDRPSKGYDLLVMLSGPEPQRTIFERLVIDQARQLPALKTLVLQGKTEEECDENICDNIRLVSHMNSEDLNEAILSSELVLTRAGYSTIMDMAVLGKKAILVPTPGQTEQDYLAYKFEREKKFYSEFQDDFNLKRALEKTEGYLGLDMRTGSENMILERVRAMLG